MPSFFSSNKSSSTDPNIRQEEKRIASDEHVDQKSLNHAINDLKKAEKTHLHAVKVCTQISHIPVISRCGLTRRWQASDKAQHALDKAVKNEHKAATTLNNSQHKHEASIMDEANAEKTLEVGLSRMVVALYSQILIIAEPRTPVASRTRSSTTPLGPGRSPAPQGCQRRACSSRGNEIDD